LEECWRDKEGELMKLVKNGKLYKKFGKKDKYETLT
jgi:hypothetical protein